MTTRKIAIAVVSFFVGMFIASAGWYFLIEPWRQTSELFGGSKGLETVSHPHSVQAFRVGNLYGSEPALTDEDVLAGPRDVPHELWMPVAKALKSPDASRWEAKACDPQYEIRLSFQRGSDSVDVLLCFFCNTLLVYRNGEFNGEKDFDDVRHQLLAAIQATFPNDESIQSISQ